MTQAFCDMLYLFSCAVHGRQPEIAPDRRLDLTAVRKQAVLQGVWPFVFTSLKHLAESGCLNGWEEQVAAWNQELLLAVMNHARRNAAAADTIHKLEEEGIPCCILKGESLARLYAVPQCRLSGDVDFLIPPELEGKACRLLEREGYELMSRGSGLPHVEADHPAAGHIEMHVQLYDGVSAEQWFADGQEITESFRKYQSDYGTFQELGPTDGALFVFFHFVKHFLNTGGGIKQLADVLVYFAACGSEIDWKRVENKLTEANCVRLFAHMIGVGVCYLGFDASAFPPADFEPELADRLMEDLYERGGFVREAEKSGVIFVPYMKRMIERDGTDSEQYLQEKQQENTKSLLFPRRKTMEKNYPYVMKSPLLLPVAWIHRAVRFAWGRLIRRIPASEQSAYQAVSSQEEKQAQRLTLARDLEML